MAKKSENVEDKGKTKTQLALEKLDKAYGKGTVLALDSRPFGNYDVISTGSIGFDWITLGVGGVVKGKLYELMGWEGCLAEDTYIKFINVRLDGIVQDCKGGTIKNLYERFHNRNSLTEDTVFNVTSINELDKVFRNPILDVVRSGKKECFELTTQRGFTIKTSKDHKFYTGNKYVSLEDLSKGDFIYVHNNTPYKSLKKADRKQYKETTLKYYYKGKPKLINGSWYFREKVHRLIFEAAQNNLEIIQYKELLNTGKLPEQFWTIPEGYDVHHIDENTENNDISNLQLIESFKHCRLHATNNSNNLRFVAVREKIISIVSVGIQETYDIKCGFPYNNFIANGIVVHNSGKSTVCGHLVANCQAKGGVALYIDGEHAVDKLYFKNLGIDTKTLLFAQPSSGEEGFQIAEDMIKTGEIDLVIIDSDSSLIPKAAMVDGDVGDSTIGKKARLNNNAYPRLKNLLSQNQVAIVVISQYREKIGVMFGNPTTTQGGHALKFYSDCRIEISRTIAKEGDQAYGNITKLKATKNKMSPPYRLSQFEIVYGKGIDIYNELVELGIEFGIIKKSGSWFSYGDTKLGQGFDGVAAVLADNPELFDEIKALIINKIKQTDDLPVDLTTEDPTEKV